MFFLVVYIHIGRGIYYGSYQKPREFVWMVGVVVLILMMATAFMGYVLPWGQMSFWAATVITNLFSAFPVVGEPIVAWLWGGFYINIHNNTVWDCPNSGIRVDNGDYVRLSYNTVYDNTFWSYNAESGIEIAQSLNRDGITNNPTTIKMRIENNIAYGNINKIPYFNPNYECKPEGGFSYDSTSTDYACAGQNYIHDGSGVYITRNRYNSDDTGGSNPNGTNYIGGFLFANNLSYGNGMNGVVVHKTNNASVFNNTVHGNGEVPSIGSTEANYSATGVN